jgi:hypothetical protein
MSTKDMSEEERGVGGAGRGKGGRDMNRGGRDMNGRVMRGG